MRKINKIKKVGEKNDGCLCKYEGLIVVLNHFNV